MRYYLLDEQQRRVGPYTREELELFAARRLLRPETLVVNDIDERALTLASWLASLAVGPLPGGTSPDGAGSAAADARVVTTAADLRRLTPHLMLPLDDIVRMRWLDNRRILAIAAAGLLPLWIISYVVATRDLGSAFWGLGLYSSLLWALFFYVVFAQPEVTIGRCVLTFLGTAVFSVGLLAWARWIVPLEWVSEWTRSRSLLTRWVGFLVGVGIVEETVKLFMLYFLWPQRPRPQVMMFYGLMAGLGFGIYEGVGYQTSYNLQFSFPKGEFTPQSAGFYYLLNILRLTSLPFLHAIWTGIAGYFVGFAAQYPRRKAGLLMVAIGVPALLHASYNTFGTSLVGLTFALLSVLALNLYLVKSRDFERVLAERAD